MKFFSNYIPTYGNSYNPLTMTAFGLENKSNKLKNFWNIHPEIDNEDKLITLMYNTLLNENGYNNISVTYNENVNITDLDDICEEDLLNSEIVCTKQDLINNIWYDINLCKQDFELNVKI